MPRDQPGQGAAGSGRHHHRDVAGRPAAGRAVRPRPARSRPRPGAVAPPRGIRYGRRPAAASSAAAAGSAASTLSRSWHPGPAHGRAPGPGQGQRGSPAVRACRRSPARSPARRGGPRPRSAAQKFEPAAPPVSSVSSAVRDRRGDQELQQPGLVPAEREPGQVVALDQQRPVPSAAASRGRRRPAAWAGRPAASGAALPASASTEHSARGSRPLRGLGGAGGGGPRDHQVGHLRAAAGVRRRGQLPGLGRAEQGRTGQRLLRREAGRRPWPRACCSASWARRAPSRGVSRASARSLTG